MLVSVIELRASNWGRNETDRTVGAGDSMNGRASGTNWRVIAVVVLSNMQKYHFWGFCFTISPIWIDGFSPNFCRYCILGHRRTD